MDSQIEQACMLMKLKNWEEANELLKEMREISPDKASGYIQGGIVLKELGKLDEALLLLDEAISKNMNAEYAKFQKAQILMKLKRWEEANELFKEMREISPDRTVGYLEGGIVLKELGKVDEAVQLWTLLDNRKARNLISNVLERIESEELYYKAWEFLAKEVFDFKMPTVLSIRIQRLLFVNGSLYHKYIDLVKNSINVDYYTKLSLGFISEPSIEYLSKIFLTGNLDIIKRVASSSPFHNINLTMVRDNNIHHFLKTPVLKRAYSNIFKNFNYSKSTFLTKRLKIAVCISGQLRGYKKAYETWDKFNFQKHDVDMFCCFWDNIGTKKIARDHMGRIFDKNFSELFIEITEGKSKEEIFNIFPQLHLYLEKPNYITEEEIKSFYSTKNVKVVKEEDYLEKSNSYKMHLMIQKSYELISHPEEYDLIIRIRPDKLLNSFDIEWNDILTNLNNTQLYSDIAPSIHRNIGLFMGDQFAVATPEVMDVYSKTFEKILKRKGVFLENSYGQFKPHTSLYLSLLEQDISVTHLYPNVKFLPPVDPSRISTIKLSELIKQDLRDNPKLLAKFLKAIEKDSKEKLN